MGVVLGAAAVSPLVGLLIAFAVGAIFGFTACMKLIDCFDSQSGGPFDWESMRRKDREVYVSGYQRGWADHQSGIAYEPHVAEGNRKFAE